MYSVLTNNDDHSYPYTHRHHRQQQQQIKKNNDHKVQHEKERPFGKTVSSFTHNKNEKFRHESKVCSMYTIEIHTKKQRITAKIPYKD